MKFFSVPPALRRERLAVPGRVLLSCLLSGGCFGGLCAPLALALTAAAGPGGPGLGCVLGAGLGALLFLPFQTGLRHLAAAILIFSGSVAFYDTRFYRRPAFRPALAAGMLLLVQSAYLIARPLQLWALCAACMAAVAAGTDLLLRQRELAAPLLGAGLCLAAGRLSLGGVSPGLALAATLLLLGPRLWPRRYRPGWGLLLGLGLGLLTEAPSLLPMAVLGGGCAVRDRFSQRPPLLRAGLFCLGGMGSALLFGAEEPLGYLWALLGGAALSLLPLPNRAPTAPREAPPPPPRRRTIQPSAALRDLYDSLFRGAAPEPPENPSVLFDRAAEQVCRRCVLRDTCWRQEYSATYQAFNDACPRLLRRGEARPGDFPSYFTSRCVQLTAFLAALNGEIRTYLLRQQYHRRLQTAHRQAREQYAQLGELLDGAQRAVPVAATRAPSCQTACSLRPRQGQSVCGDQLAVFEAGGSVCLLLSDGMGSGEAAHREAAMTVRLLRQFLEAGIEPVPALKTMNTALSLRGESGGGFNTVDLLVLRREDGQAALYKYGAAPSYLKRGGSVSRFTGSSLPVGLQGVSEPPECTRLQLSPGSFFVMISDGIADAGSDEWLQDLLAGWDGTEAQALTELILRESRGRRGLADDCAVLVARLPGPDAAGQAV